MFINIPNSKYSINTNHVMLFNEDSDQDGSPTLYVHMRDTAFYLGKESYMSSEEFTKFLNNAESYATTAEINQQMLWNNTNV